MRCWRRIPILLSLIVMLAAFLPAQEKLTTALIPREVLFGNPERSDPQISPDGTQVGYLAPANGVLNVWIRTLGKNDDRAITDDKHRGIRRYASRHDV